MLLQSNMWAVDTAHTLPASGHTCRYRVFLHCHHLQGIDEGMLPPELEGEFGPLRQWIFDQRWTARQIVEDTRFNQAFLGITILNTLFLALSYDGMRQPSVYVFCMPTCLFAYCQAKHGGLLCLRSASTRPAELHACLTHGQTRMTISDEPSCSFAGMSDTLAHTLSISNYVFTGLFTFEMVLKLFALGLLEYIADRFNCFDGFVVIMSLVEIVLDVSLLPIAA